VSKEEKNAEVLKKIQFIESSRDELESMKDNIVSSVREEIEMKMDEYFNEIIWKEEDLAYLTFYKCLGPKPDTSFQIL